jgi:hypothetical protein
MLSIVYFFIKTHDVSETGVCLRRQVKDTHSAGPNRVGVFYLMTETDSSLRNVVFFTKKIDNV